MPRLVAGFWLGRGLAQSKHLQLMLAFANRLHAPVQEARRLVAAGRLGRLYGVEMHLVADQTRLKSHDYHHSWFAHKDRAGGVPDPERLAPLVQTALSLDEKHELYQWALFSKALHDYRCGRFAEARTACRNGRERATADFAALSVIDRTVEAMSLYRLGKTDDARQALAAADRLLDEQGPQLDGGDLGELWHDWLCCRILRREASRTIGGPAHVNAQK